MAFKKDEIRVDLDEEFLAEGLTVPCDCGHTEWMHPEVLAPEKDPFFCGECGHVFGTWGEVHRQLFTGGAMLDAVLTSRPAPPTD